VKGINHLKVIRVVIVVYSILLLDLENILVFSLVIVIPIKVSDFLIYFFETFGDFLSLPSPVVNGYFQREVTYLLSMLYCYKRQRQTCPCPYRRLNRKEE